MRWGGPFSLPFSHQILIPLKSSMPRLPPVLCLHLPSFTAALPMPVPQGPGLWLVIHSKAIMGDKKLMATQSVNGYSNQITTSNVLANSLAIHPTLAPRNRVVGIPGWQVDILHQQFSFIDQTLRYSCLMYDYWLIHDVLKEDTLYSSTHGQGKPDLWLLFSLVSFYFIFYVFIA